MKLTAKFIKLLTPQTGSSPNGNWIKQDFIVESKETYPKKVVITNWNNQFASQHHAWWFQKLPSLLCVCLFTLSFHAVPNLCLHKNNETAQR